MMRVVYIGCKEIGKTVLDALMEFYTEGIVGVYTYADEMSNKYTRNSSFDSVMAKYPDTLYRKIEDINNPDVLDEIRSLKPDVIIQFGWSHLIKKDLINIPPKGCVGFHSSLLPKYRGGSPLNWGIINGETEWGMTCFYLTPGLDDGDIIAQEKFPIEEYDTCKTLYDKAVESSIKMLKENLPKIANGTAERIPQNSAEVTLVKRRKPEDGKIDWDMPVKKIYDLIRGTTRPFPGAFTFLGDEKIIVWASRKTGKDSSGSASGKILEITDKGVVVSTGNESLLLTDIEYEKAHDTKIDKQYIGKKLGEIV
jgi:methionyl-tRNA formyltransferase